MITLNVLCLMIDRWSNWRYCAVLIRDKHYMIFVSTNTTRKSYVARQIKFGQCYSIDVTQFILPHQKSHFGVKNSPNSISVQLLLHAPWSAGDGIPPSQVSTLDAISVSISAPTATYTISPHWLYSQIPPGTTFLCSQFNVRLSAFRHGFFIRKFLRTLKSILQCWKVYNTVS